MTKTTSNPTATTNNINTLTVENFNTTYVVTAIPHNESTITLTRPSIRKQSIINYLEQLEDDTITPTLSIQWPKRVEIKNVSVDTYNVVITEWIRKEYSGMGINMNFEDSEAINIFKTLTFWIKDINNYTNRQVRIVNQYI
jgi:hypothetical protein